jgi:hypothetical protein
MFDKQNTRDEFNSKYGDIEVTFSSYYKYTFTYEATLPDGKKLTISCGGNHYDIYRHEVICGRAEKVSKLQFYEANVYEGANRLDWYYDY